MKYTEEILTEAVRRSTSMVWVMRFLGVKPSGGAHAHLRRRIDYFGIDTGHFRGRAHNQGKASPRRLRPEEILVRLPEGSGRGRAPQLRRALVAIGVPHACTECGLDGTWRGRPITLHVDHINGDYLDCRSENVRFLCPNCHSQTWNFAGRGKSRVRRSARSTSDQANPRRVQLITDADKIMELFGLVDRGILTVTRTVELIGCSKAQYYRLRQRLAETGSLDKEPEGQASLRRRTLVARDSAVIESALANPGFGKLRVAAVVQSLGQTDWNVSPNAVAAVLQRVGLAVHSQRRAASGARIWSARNEAAKCWAKPALALLHMSLLAMCGKTAGKETRLAYLTAVGAVQ